MKRTGVRHLGAGLALAALATCGGIDRFEIVETSRSTVDRASTPLEQLAGQLGFGDFLNVDITQNQELQNQGVERHQIDSVKIGAFTLEIVETPEGQDFSFIEEIQFFVEAEGLARQRVAHGSMFPPGARRISLDVDGVELADYTAAPSMNITTEVRGRRPENDTTVEATVTILVDADIGGVLCGE